MKFKNIVLTGATGIVGQHILFELLDLYCKENRNGKIFVIIRHTAKQTSLERVETLLNNSFLPDYLKAYSIADLLSKIVIIDSDLTSPKIKNVFSFVKEDNVCVLHCAASTNLEPSEEAEKEVKFANYHASINLLNSCIRFVSKFVFISSAFSCGIRKGFVDEDYLSFSQDKYRNPYEKYKLLAEREIAAICQKNEIPVQILRPSIVCGRLLDTPLYYTPKFDVFYGFSNFFYKIMETPFAKSSLRIVASPEHVVSNVIPVDYAAKAIVRAINYDEIFQMNITNSKFIPLSFSLTKMLQINGYDKYEIVKNMPTNMNMLEATFYSEYGNIFTPFLNGERMDFDARTIRKIMHDIIEPDIVEHLSSLLAFAAKHKFNNLINWK